MPEQDTWKSQALAWLLEEDAENPGVRFMALRDLTSASAEHLAAAQAVAVS